MFGRRSILAAAAAFAIGSTFGAGRPPAAPPPPYDVVMENCTLHGEGLFHLPKLAPHQRGLLRNCTLAAEGIFVAGGNWTCDGLRIDVVVRRLQA